jgi:hypothetical protein
VGWGWGKGVGVRVHGWGAGLWCTLSVLLSLEREAMPRSSHMSIGRVSASRGCCTLMATRWLVALRVAVCTCAIEPDARGAVSKEEKSSLGGAPKFRVRVGVRI